MMQNLSEEQRIQEEEYRFPYHYLNLLSPFQDIEYVSYIKLVKSIISPLKGKRILDFGCGDGRFEYELRDEDCKIIGIDFSEKAVGFARAFNKKAEFIVKDIMNFKDNKKFDYIVSIETFEHIPKDELPRIVKKLASLLKQNGRMIITVPSNNISLSPKHYQHFDEKSLICLLEGNFRIERIIGQYNLGFSTMMFRLLNAIGRAIEIINKESMLAEVYSNFLWNFYRRNIEIAKLNKAKRIIAVCSLKNGK